VVLKLTRAVLAARVLAGDPLTTAAADGDPAPHAAKPMTSTIATTAATPFLTLES
jgi:hypothetical protein